MGSISWECRLQEEVTAATGWPDKGTAAAAAASYKQPAADAFRRRFLGGL